ncbi:hypothetical protein Tco_0329218 [Tanacetum coccineum]
MAEQQEIQQQDHLDEELVPVNDQVRIGLSNFRIALEKQQPYVIYKLCLEILRQYSFFKAFTGTDDHASNLMQVPLELNFANKGEKYPNMEWLFPKEDDMKKSGFFVVEKKETIKILRKKHIETVIEQTGQSEKVADIVDSEETDEDEVHLNKRHTGIVIGRWVHKESKEGTLDHLKKLKGIET